MSSHPVLSILMPVYNVEEYLPRCIASVRRQTFSEWELICVNDGSTDRSLEILNTFANMDSRIVIEDQPNKGVAAARQRALEQARGDYIGWIDPDDWCDSTHFAGLVEIALLNNSDLAWCDVVEERLAEKVVVNQRCMEDANALLGKIIRHDLRGSLWDKIFKRDLITAEHIQFPSRDKCEIMEDNYFLYQFLLHARRISYVHAATYHYVIRIGSLSNPKTDATEWWRQVIKANTALYEILNNRVDKNLILYRIGLFKSWMFFDRCVPDDMYYGFFPSLKFLVRNKLTIKQRLAIMATAYFGRTKLLKVLSRIGK